MIDLPIRYLKKYWISSLFFGYMIISTIIRAYTSFEATIPCLIRVTTGHTCYGCGLTTATIRLLHLDVYGAWLINPLVFVVLPVLLILWIRHWLRFVADQTSK